MSATRSICWCLLVLASALGGCRARLPLGPAPDSTEATAAATAPRTVAGSPAHRPAARPPRAWSGAGPGETHGRRLGDAYVPPLDPDRLRDVVRYNPPPTGIRTVGDFLLRIDICAPGGHGR